jgi:hypothetical protein
MGHSSALVTTATGGVLQRAVRMTPGTGLRYFNDGYVNRYNYYEENGFSVRCVRNLKRKLYNHGKVISVVVFK